MLGMILVSAYITRFREKSSAGFVDWYNNRHWHSGMQYITPMQKRRGEHIKIFAERNETLIAAKDKFPKRWGKRATRKFIVKEQEVLNSD